ncbi:uncharacterized protein KIAA1614-like isoform X2 [Carcharodon carcharias]|uniref:uncharacterized protein KIAA1614-like isoform X2 n=1 Tax=Carcharodon carcharias TaxID=13397 RepID=UPI001B7E194B|nr:uncharacterized protein KIAA1614-like isoform X2 [Carcharodon carcharias]
MRAFVSSSQLPLSRRHEQAKRLLERARMKARASPLKADHSILPIERNPLEASTDGTSSPKRGPFSRDGPSSNARNSGYLSDSSSGESHCGLRKKRSQSPSRVRFEDESTQEAEVRYQLRRKCGTEYSAHRGPKGLMPRPGLPAYGLPGKEGLPKASSGDGSKTYCKNAQGRGAWRSGGNPITNGEKPTDKTNISHINTAICIDGKCSSCGSHIISDSKAGSFAPPSYTFPDIRTVPQGKELYLHKWHELPLDTATGVKTNLAVEAEDVGSLSTSAVPCWVLPSEHRIRIEPIRETYIGDVTSIDDISVVDGEEVAVSCQDNAAEVNDREGTTVSAYCYAIVSGSNMRTTDGLKLNAKDIDWPRRGTGENSVTFEPASATADCNSKSRRKTLHGRGDCTQQVQCQSKEPVNSSQELRISADPKPVISVCMSKDSHVASLSSEQDTETSPELLQPTPQSPSPKSDQSSKQSRARVTVHGSPVPRKRGTRSLGSGQVKKIPPPLHSQNRSRVLNSHPTDPTLPPQFTNKTSCQHPLLKRPLISRANLTIPSTSQQSGMPLILKSQPATHLTTYSSPQYRLVHLDLPGNDGSLPDSQAVLETSSLQPQQPMPNDHILALHTSDPSAHCLSNSAIRLPRDTVTVGCSSQSLGNYRSEVGMRSSQVANQFTDASGGLLRPEHHDPVEPTKNRNCLTSASAEQSAETNNKTERCSMMVKTQSLDTTTNQEDPAPDPGEHQALAQPPEPGTSTGEPETRTGSCGEGSAHHPANRPVEGQQVPAIAGSSSGAQHSPKSHQKSSSSLKAFFCTIGHSTVSKLNRLRSSSLEQINSRSTDNTSDELRCEEIRTKLRKTPSLQSLRLVSPLVQLRKAASFQSLHSQKKSRYNSYLVGEATETGLGHSKAKPSGRRPITSFSTEDIGSPNHPRVIGQVTQTFADASFMLELSKPAHGPFGFLISRSCGRLFIHQMADQNAEKLYVGLLELGDEILEVNGECVEDLSFNEVNSLMLQGSTVSIRIRRHNGTSRQQEH